MTIARDRDRSGRDARIAPISAARLSWTCDGAFGHDGPVSLKLEFLQHAGSFKTRGAFNTLLSHDGPRRRRGGGVRRQSRRGRGLCGAGSSACKARIFVPEISSPAKIAVIRAHGAEVVIGGARYADAQDACDRLRRRERRAARPSLRGARARSPARARSASNGKQDGAGPRHGPRGGRRRRAHRRHGELVGGRVKVVGVEPEGSRALHAALEAGRPGRCGRRFGRGRFARRAQHRRARLFDLPRQTVDHVALVPDAAIREAQRLLWRDYRIASEPGGAAALAALISGRLSSPRRASGSACSSAGPMSICASLPRSPTRHGRTPMFPQRLTEGYRAFSTNAFRASRTATRHSPRRASRPRSW